VFREWGRLAPEGVEVLPIQYPGRETRWREPVPSSVPELVKQLIPAILPLLDRPMILFGHSLGAVIAFEVARSLQAHGLREPARLVVSASGPPGERSDISGIYDLPDDALIARLRKLNGIPEEALAHQGFLELMLPVIRADLKLAGTYSHVPSAPLSCPLRALGGRSDPLVREPALARWAAHSSRFDGVQLLDGDHFYLRRHPPSVLKAVLHGLNSSHSP
jgi:surfactin synthase thioesterase subunit